MVRDIKKNEQGSVMVEVLAVLALLSLMGTVLYRQVFQRNQELDNINMATEIRTVKEAALAYIQASKTTLNQECISLADYSKEDSGVWKLDNPISVESLEAFLPVPHVEAGLAEEFDMPLFCYNVDPGENAYPAFFALIIPKSGNEGPLPSDMNLKRAARVANLIGADGGIYQGTGDTISGTMGNWQFSCLDGDAECRENEAYYLATTGTDNFVQEVIPSAEGTVGMPHDAAFGKLHAKDYFSVGDTSANCLGNYTDSDKFAHETLDASGQVQQDVILSKGDGDCDPLFWVEAATSDGVAVGNVVVKDAVSITSHANDSAKRRLSVFNVDGTEQLTLDATGRVMAGSTVDADGNVTSGNGYRLDTDGSMVFFKGYNFTLGDKTGIVEVPYMTLKDGKMITEEYMTLPDGTLEKYGVNPTGTSHLEDIRLGSRGGAKLSDLLPKYILKDIVIEEFKTSISEISGTEGEVGVISTRVATAVCGASATETPKSCDLTECTSLCTREEPKTGKALRTGVVKSCDEYYSVTLLGDAEYQKLAKCETVEYEEDASNLSHKIAMPQDCSVGYRPAIIVAPNETAPKGKLRFAYAELPTGDTSGGHILGKVAKLEGNYYYKDIDFTADSSGKQDYMLFNKQNVHIDIQTGTDEDADKWDIALQYNNPTNDEKTIPTDEDPISAVIQTYCVYDPSENITYDADRLKYADVKEVMACSSDEDCCPVDSEDCNIYTCDSGVCQDKCAGQGTDASGSTAGYYCFGNKTVKVDCVADSQCSGGKSCIGNICQ